VARITGNSLIRTRRSLQRVRAIEESVTYQAILERGIKKGVEKGTVVGERSLLLRQARQRFVNPNAEQQAALGAIVDRERLGRMADRLLIATSWQDLLATV
jgi:predicted transposase YdaD